MQAALGPNHPMVSSARNNISCILLDEVRGEYCVICAMWQDENQRMFLILTVVLATAVQICHNNVFVQAIELCLVTLAPRELRDCISV